MNKKVSLLIVSVVLTIIVFAISTYMQKKLVNYIPTMKCIVVNSDIEAYEKIDKESIEYVDMPIEIIAKTRIIQNFSEIENLYLKDKVYKGQILVFEQFDTKENLMIYNADLGKEKLAIKIKSAENGVSFTIRENSIVNVYATLRNEYIQNLNTNEDTIMLGTVEDGYSVIKVLDSVKILGTFDVNGENLENTFEKNIDTILVAVSPEEARNINLIREIASFNVTELGRTELNTISNE